MAKGTLRVRIVGDASALEKTLGKATGTLGRFAKVGVLGAGAAVAGGVALSVKAFADFDAAMTGSLAIMGDVSDAMQKDMSNAAREVAKTTKFSATDAANSYFYLASAGLDAAQSIEALPKVAAFAQAGAFDMARATDLLTDAQSALGLAADDAAENLRNLSRVGDVLVKANTLANASVEQFSESLTEKAGAALRMLNKDVEEGVAVLAVYADQGTKGSAAGTQLNAVLEGLTRTARVNADAYKDLGVQVFDSSGEMRNMADIVGNVEKALDGMTTEQQLAELSALGLTRQALDGTRALLGQSDAIREYERELRNAGGTVDEIANKQLQTFWAQLGLVKDNLLDVALSVGEALMPALTAFTDWLMAALPGITDFFDRVTGRFTDLFAVAEESTDGVNTSLEGMGAKLADTDGLSKAHLEAMGADFIAYNSIVDDVAMKVEAQLLRMGQKLADHRDLSDEQLRAMGEDFLAFNGVVLDVSDSTGDEMDHMGTLMGKLGAAWREAWDNDIKPWLLDTLLPWLEDVFFPKLIEAFKRAGVAAAGALWDGVKGIPGNVLRNMAPMPRATFESFARPSVPFMAEGGIVRASAGGTLAYVGEGHHDEAVLPLHRGVYRELGRAIADAGGAGGGAPLVGEIHLHGNDAKAMMPEVRHQLRMLAAQAAY